VGTAVTEQDDGKCSSRLGGDGKGKRPLVVTQGNTTQTLWHKLLTTVHHMWPGNWFTLNIVLAFRMWSKL